ncbi:patatin-like phospholipase family protein [Agromyces aureus]|uniref:Patatin n=1 Tax=Agromyces aureus TaxID=453304 RepID=A0A191WC65_9MICO|nr:patatin-like phospholipase family protein [Agromyces aureus]ANJ25832.1 patatin [Agromyces aureus]
MNTTTSSMPEASHHAASTTGRRALVLGGGGSAGNAWLIGVIAGLHEAGLDVTRADLMIGTSAGATAAAQITGTAPAALLAAVLTAVPPQRTAPDGSERRGAFAGSANDHLERFRRIIADSADAGDMRRRMGAIGIEQDAATNGARQAPWRSTVAARLPQQQWPEQDVRLTAVDARTGEPVVLDRDSGVDLADAVAASCAGGFAYLVGDRYLIDGGYRRNENADLAGGFERVLVLSPLGGRTLHPLGWGMQLAAQVDELRAGGSRVETVVPDEPALAAFGDNLMDLSTRPPAARAGHAQGLALATRLSGFWN